MLLLVLHSTLAPMSPEQRAFLTVTDAFNCSTARERVLFRMLLTHYH